MEEPRYIHDTKEVIASRPVSDHPGDRHLEILLCRWRSEWVTWAYNKQTNDAFHGHYFKDETKARQDFARRGALH